ncbi:MAG: sigma-70 family RNA polymerase sigma factor [Micropruina sp.]
MARGFVFSQTLQDRQQRTESLFSELARVRSTSSRQGIVSELVSLHLDLCDGLARRYAARGIDRDDLNQVARMGLLLALRRYRPEEGPSFTAFAVPTICGELKRHFRDHGWMVRPPRRIQELHAHTRTRRAELEQELGRSATADDIAVELDVEARQVQESDSVASSFRPLSLEAPVSASGDLVLGDLLASDDADLEQLPDLLTLRSSVQQLTERQRTVLHLRFVEDFTQSQIADELGISQMQVSRILRATLSQLRTLMGDEAAA